MRGSDETPRSPFSYLDPEDRIAGRHPRRKIRASLQQIVWSIRPERQLMKQMNCHLWFLWFTGLGADHQIWVPTVFSRIRVRCRMRGCRDPALYFRNALSHGWPPGRSMMWWGRPG